MTPVEAMAADALLDRRLKINLPAPWLLRIFGRKTVPIRVKLPTAGSLIQMSSLFTRMEIDLQHLHDGNFGSVLEQIAKHGVTTSRIIAYGLLRGTWSARLLNRPLAWYIRQHMPMQGLAELAKIIVLMSTSAFCEHYRIGRFAEPDEADGGEPADRDRELKEEYDPPHSPFGQIYTLVQQGAFTYDEIMNRIPWCVVLTMISDQGRMRKKKEKEETLQSEEEELEFFGLK